LNLSNHLATIPSELTDDRLTLAEDGTQLIYTYDAKAGNTGIAELIKKLGERGIDFKDLQTKESSLEEYFCHFSRESIVNIRAIRTIYAFEMARLWDTIVQSLLAPVISTSLYFGCFWIGDRIAHDRY